MTARNDPILSVLILTHDEEENLPRCIASLHGLDAPLFVMDSGSTDGTLEIARSAGATVWEHPFDNYAAQRNRAQALIPSDLSWVLHLDAADRLTPELAREIGDLFDGGEPGQAGFLLRKRTIFMGRWIKHGAQYPAYHLRLFRRDRGHCEDRLYDQHFVVEGEVGRLRNDYLDEVAVDLKTWTQRHLKWAPLEAQEIRGELVSEGRVVEPSLSSGPLGRKRWLRKRVLYRAPLFLRAFLHWIYRYFFRLGFLDGTEGLIYHFLQGFWYRFYVDAVIVEQRRSKAG